MDLARYFSVLLKGWKVIAAAALIGAVLAGVYSMLSTPQYRATTTLFFYLSAATKRKRNWETQPTTTVPPPHRSAKWYTSMKT